MIQYQKKTLPNGFTDANQFRIGCPSTRALHHWTTQPPLTLFKDDQFFCHADMTEDHGTMSVMLWWGFSSRKRSQLTSSVLLKIVRRFYNTSHLQHLLEFQHSSIFTSCTQGWQFMWKKYKWNQWKNEMFYLTTGSTHFIYGYMALDIWVKDLSESLRGILAGTRNSSIGPPWGIDLMTHSIMSRCSTMEPHLAPKYKWQQSEMWYSSYWCQIVLGLAFCCVFCIHVSSDDVRLDINVLSVLINNNEEEDDFDGDNIGSNSSSSTRSSSSGGSGSSSSNSSSSSSGCSSSSSSSSISSSSSSS